jgi:hypothetical protein
MTAGRQSDSDEVRANAAITRFLDYYVNPGRLFDYAVMVNGPWGSGKTHLIKEFIKRRSTPKALYITLNGISSADQIDQEFYRQLHPILSSRGMRIAGAVARALGKGALKMDFSKEESGTLNVSVSEIDLTEGLANPRDRLLIFDDLERCKMPMSEVLGYINGFVEHDGLKAIILANETEIRTNLEPRYDEIREKLIGQTLTVSAPAGEAFEAFIGEVSHETTRGFLRRHKEAVLALHAQGGRGNLRTLKHAMWDFEKIGSQLEQRHWDKEESVLKIMKLVIAITTEYRAGELNENDLVPLFGNRVWRLMGSKLHKENSKVDLIDERYPQIDFDQSLVGTSTLGAILFRGEMDARELIAEIDATSDYANPAEQPLWLRAQRTFTYDDATCDRIAADVECAFANREFIARGEFLLIAGTRLLFAKIGLISKTCVEIVDESTAYIDDLSRQDRLETTLDRLRDDSLSNSYHGYVFSEWESSEHHRIVDYYDEQAQLQEEKRYPQIARELLGKLSIDPDGFLFDLAPNTVNDGRYWSLPVLASLPPEEYARTAFDASPDIQSRAIQTLHSRHVSNPEPALEAELPWIAEVKATLEKLMPKAKPMTRFRLQSLIARYLIPLCPTNHLSSASCEDIGPDADSTKSTA